MKSISGLLRRSENGFTIVELLIVIVVIGILAAISIIAYNGITSKAQISLLQSTLATNAQAMEIAKTTSGTDTYPTAFPSNVKTASNVGLSLSDNGTSYCINAQTISQPVLRYYMSPDTGVQAGTCPGAVISQSELGMPANQVLDTGFSMVPVSGVTWRLYRGAGGNIDGVSRSGTTGDPFPNRKVLRISNTPTGSATWYFISGPMRIAGVTAGQSYTTSYWVRLASGTLTATIDHFGVELSSGMSPAFSPTNGTVPIDSTWRQITRTVTAGSSAAAGDIIYMTLNGADSNIQNNSFTLEYQGFEID